MTNINRRNLLQSFAASTILASVAPSEGAPAQAPIRDTFSNSEKDSWDGAWLIARQNLQTSGEHIVDLWSKPFCKIRHAEYLPLEIARGVLWHEYGGYIPNISSVPTLIEQSQLVARSVLGHDDRLQRK